MAFARDNFRQYPELEAPEQSSISHVREDRCMKIDSHRSVIASGDVPAGNSDESIPTLGVRTMQLPVVANCSPESDQGCNQTTQTWR